MPSRRPTRSSASAGAIYLDREAALAALRRLAQEALGRDPRLTRVILFGSLARGDATPASDADIVVLMRQGEARRMDRVPRLLELMQESPLPLDLHPYTISEWEQALARGDPLARRAEREGIELAARGASAGSGPGARRAADPNAHRKD